MDVRTIVPTDGRLEIFCQTRAVGLPQPVANPVADQRMQTRVKENGQHRELDTRAPCGGRNDVAADGFLVLLRQIVQEELFDLRSWDQF